MDFQYTLATIFGAEQFCFYSWIQTEITYSGA